MGITGGITINSDVIKCLLQESWSSLQTETTEEDAYIIR